MNRNHWTLARAHYDKKERSIDIAYFDSYNGSVHGHNSEAKERVGVINESLTEAIESAFGPEYLPDMTTIRDIKMQKQDDHSNCGVFVCIGMLRCIRGGTPSYKARNRVTAEDIANVRCIIEEETATTQNKERLALEQAEEEEDDMIVLN